MGRAVVMAGRLTGASRGRRRVYVSVSESLTATDQPEVDAVLGELLLCRDEVIVVGEASPARAVSFAERHGIVVEYGGGSDATLVVAVLDPLMPHGSGNVLPLNALASAEARGIDRVAAVARPWRRR